jgi:ABC-type transport system substrate-binding protein
VARREPWHGEDKQPYLDGISVLQPRDADEVEAGLRTKRLDVAFVGRPAADRLRQVIPQLVEIPAGLSSYLGMRFFLPQYPYSDPRFRAAVTYALDRNEMIRRFFAESGEPNAWISWPMKRWALTPQELSGLPGYRPGSGGRQQDISEARALLAAVRDERGIPEALSLIVVDDVERTLGVGSLIQQQLARNLGLEVGVFPMSLGEITARLLAQQAPWVAGPDTGWIDLDDWVYPYFHSSGVKNTFALRDEALDGMLASQRADFDHESRRRMGYAIQRRLLELNAGVNFVSERVIALAWPYVRQFPLDAGDGYQGRMAQTWLDRSDASFRGR